MYSPDVKPEHKFDAILDKIHKKMVILQRRYPSLTARVLLANSLLSSCLWYFAYFIPPTDEQLKLCDSKVWGMIWGRTPGKVNAIGKVHRGRMVAPREEEASM